MTGLLTLQGEWPKGTATKDFREVAFGTSLERQTRVCEAEKRMGRRGGNSTSPGVRVLRRAGYSGPEPSGRGRGGLIPDWKSHPSILKAENQSSLMYPLLPDPGGEF